MNKNTIILLILLVLIAGGISYFFLKLEPVIYNNQLPKPMGIRVPEPTQDDIDALSALRLANEERNCPAESRKLLEGIGLNFPKGDNDERLVPGGAEPDGRYGLGQIVAVRYEGSKMFLTIDTSLWFSNNYSHVGANNANMAIKEDTPDNAWDAPNGFYIRNRSHSTREYQLAPDAFVTVVGMYSGDEATPGMCGASVVGANEFAKRAKENIAKYPGGYMPINFDVSADGIITKIAERYVP